MTLDLVISSHLSIEMASTHAVFLCPVCLLECPEWKSPRCLTHCRGCLLPLSCLPCLLYPRSVPEVQFHHVLLPRRVYSPEDLVEGRFATPALVLGGHCQGPLRRCYLQNRTLGSEQVSSGPVEVISAQGLSASGTLDLATIACWQLRITLRSARL